MKLIESLEPDLVFLDVQMPGLDGLGVIRKLQEKGVSLPYFVFSTAYDQYAVEAFRLEAMDYLLKPVEKERLAVTSSGRRREIETRQAAAPLTESAAASAEADSSANQAAGEKQQPQSDPGCAGSDLRHHRRRLDHGCRAPTSKAIPITGPLKNCNRTSIRISSGAYTARSWSISTGSGK